LWNVSIVRACCSRCSRCFTARCAVSPSTGSVWIRPSVHRRRTRRTGAVAGASSVTCVARRTNTPRCGPSSAFSFRALEALSLFIVIFNNVTCYVDISQPLLECDRCQNCYHDACLGSNYPKPNRKRKAWASEPFRSGFIHTTRPVLLRVATC